MSNSPLITHTNLTKNYSKRTSKIDTITIHCFVGQVTAERGCEVFIPAAKKASCNYVIGYDGSVGLSVEEKNRSWCSSSTSNDDRAITIEVASDNFEPYAITDKAYSKLIELCADICKRNGITKLVWSTNRTARVNHLNGCNLTVHRDYAKKSCPGDYIYSRMSQIVNEVNKMITVNSNEPSDYAKESWEKLKAAGATDGSNPKGNATREQIAVMLDRLGLI